MSDADRNPPLHSTLEDEPRLGRPAADCLPTPRSTAASVDVNASAPPAPLLVDAGGLGALLGVSRATIFRLDKSDRLPDGTRLGACRRWAVEEVRAWVAAGMPGRFEWRARLNRRAVKVGRVETP